MNSNNRAIVALQRELHGNRGWGDMERTCSNHKRLFRTAVRALAYHHVSLFLDKWEVGPLRFEVFRLAWDVHSTNMNMVYMCPVFEGGNYVEGDGRNPYPNTARLLSEDYPHNAFPAHILGRNGPPLPPASEGLTLTINTNQVASLVRMMNVAFYTGVTYWITKSIMLTRDTLRTAYERHGLSAMLPHRWFAPLVGNGEWPFLPSYREECADPVYTYSALAYMSQTCMGDMPAYVFKRWNEWGSMTIECVIRVPLCIPNEDASYVAFVNRVALDIGMTVRHWARPTYWRLSPICGTIVYPHLRTLLTINAYGKIDVRWYNTETGPSHHPWGTLRDRDNMQDEWSGSFNPTPLARLRNRVTIHHH